MDGWNYFNYFTEIEEYFWKKRGAHLLVSPLDWAIMETWQKAGVPLDAVLKGIDRAFESYQRSRRGAGKPLKSLAYCTDAVLEAAAERQEAAAGARRKMDASDAEPFSRDELRAYFEKNAAQIVGSAEKQKCASGIGRAADGIPQLLGIEPSAPRILREPRSGRPRAPPDHPRRESPRRADSARQRRYDAADPPRSRLATFRMYRRKMKAEQMALVEKQYMQKRLLEEFGLPRLSLYYFS